MTLQKLSDHDWFAANHERVYRLRDREKSDPKKHRFWPFAQVSRYVIVRRNWVGGFCTFTLPVSFDSMNKSKQLLFSNSDALLCSYINVHVNATKASYRRVDLMRIALVRIIDAIKFSRGKK